jgi:hypothetical protein
LCGPAWGALQLTVQKRAFFAGNEEAFGRGEQLAASIFEGAGDGTGGVTAFANDKTQGGGVDMIQGQAGIESRYLNAAEVALGEQLQELPNCFRGPQATRRRTDDQKIQTTEHISRHHADGQRSDIPLRARGSADGGTYSRGYLFSVTKNRVVYDQSVHQSRSPIFNWVAPVSRMTVTICDMHYLLYEWSLRFIRFHTESSGQLIQLCAYNQATQPEMQSQIRRPPRRRRLEAYNEALFSTASYLDHAAFRRAGLIQAL